MPIPKIDLETGIFVSSIQTLELQSPDANANVVSISDNDKSIEIYNWFSRRNVKAKNKRRGRQKPRRI